MRRKTLSEIDHYLHSSIIGTCLKPSIVKKLFLDSTNNLTSDESDYEIHSGAVCRIQTTVKFANTVAKMLDNKFKVDIFKTSKISEPTLLLKYWKENIISFYI